MQTKRASLVHRCWQPGYVAAVALALLASGCVLPKKVTTQTSTFTTVEELENDPRSEVTAKLDNGFIEVVAIKSQMCVARDIEEIQTVTGTRPRLEGLSCKGTSCGYVAAAALLTLPVTAVLSGIVASASDDTTTEQQVEHARRRFDCSRPIAHARVEAGGHAFKTNQWGRLRFRVPQKPARGPWKVTVSNLPVPPETITVSVARARDSNHR